MGSPFFHIFINERERERQSFKWPLIKVTPERKQRRSFLLFFFSLVVSLLSCDVTRLEYLRVTILNEYAASEDATCHGFHGFKLKYKLLRISQTFSHSSFFPWRNACPGVNFKKLLCYFRIALLSPRELRETSELPGVLSFLSFGV